MWEARHRTEPDSRVCSDCPGHGLIARGSMGETGGSVRGNFSIWRPDNGKVQSPFRCREKNMAMDITHLVRFWSGMDFASSLINTAGLKKCWEELKAKLQKLMLDITNEEEPGSMSREKKLLNSIEKVEKIVTNEIMKLKSTEEAKREEQERRMKTLMSMRS